MAKVGRSVAFTPVNTIPNYAANPSPLSRQLAGGQQQQAAGAGFGQAAFGVADAAAAGHAGGAVAYQAVYHGTAADKDGR